MKFTFTFNSKITYLVYRKEWAQRYLASINAIRAAKRQIRETNSRYSKGEGSISDLWTAHFTLKNCHDTTSTLLLELAAARVEAGNQMRQNKAH